MTDIVLPKGIKASDCSRPKMPASFWNMSGKKQDEWYKKPCNRIESDFYLWLIEGRGGEKFWVIPTLFISKGKQTDRYYAIRIDNKQLMSVGKGPHVLREVHVYVRESRASALAEFSALKETGMLKANQYRDSLSTKRMNSRRRSFGW